MKEKKRNNATHNSIKNNKILGYKFNQGIQRSVY